jgi:hypothetical protein
MIITRSNVDFQVSFKGAWCEGLVVRVKNYRLGDASKTVLFSDVCDAPGDLLSETANELAEQLLVRYFVETYGGSAEEYQDENLLARACF